MTELPGFVNTAAVVYNVATALRNARIEERARREAAALRVIDAYRWVLADLARIEAVVRAQEEAGASARERRLLALRLASKRLKKSQGVKGD